MLLPCIKDQELLGSELHDLGKFPVQSLAGNQDFLLGIKSIHVVVSGGLTLQQFQNAILFLRL